MSRYGIKVTEEEVRERILDAFGQHSGRKEESIYYDALDDGDAEIGGANYNSENEGCIDLTRVLALLLVPVLLKAERSLVQQTQLQSNLPSIPEASHNEENGTSEVTSTTPFLSHNTPSAGFQQQQHGEKGEKRWPDDDLIENILRMMLHDATGDPNPRPLTKELLRQILSFYGECEIADDDQLLVEMLMAAANNASTNSDNASADIEGEPIIFDQHAFARALTHDVQQYDIDYENRSTTNYYDVFQTCHSTKKEEKRKWLPRLPNPMKTVEISGRGGEDVRPVQRVFTFPSIDYTADTFRSKVRNLHDLTLKSEFPCFLVEQPPY